LEVVKKNDDIVTGSFAQEILVKKQFSRKHKDIDILTRNRAKLIKDLKKEFGKDIKFRKRKNSIELIFKNKVIADLVKLDIGEQGFARKFRFAKHKGLNIASVEARLASKVAQLGKGKRGKVVRDIEKLTGKKLRETTKKGAFGFKKKQQEKLIGKTGDIVTAQIDFLGKGILKPSELKLKRWLFASPFNPKTGKGQLRVSRLGIGLDEEASLLDLLKGDVSFRGNKPQIFVFPKEKIFKSKGTVLKKSIDKTSQGFVIPNFSSELEVVLGEGFLIKRVKKLDSVPIKGKLVPIIELKKIKVPKNVKQSLSEVKSLQSNLKKTKGKKRKDLINKIDKAEKKVNKKIKRATGFDYFSSSKLVKRKVVNLKKVAASGVVRSVSRFNKVSAGGFVGGFQPIRGKGISKRTPSPKGKPPKSPPSPPPKTTKGGKQPSKTFRKIKPPVTPPPTIIPPKPPAPSKKKKLLLLKIGREKPKRKRKKRIRSYDVFARPLKSKKGKKSKKKPKLIQINKRRLSKEDAKNLRNFVVDQSLSRRGSIRKRRIGKPQKPLLRVPSGYAKKTSKKFRRFKIKKGKRIALRKGSVIEKTKHIQDVKNEKLALSLKKQIALLNKAARKPIRRTPAQRKVMLNNLKKARRARKKNLLK